MPAVPEGAVVMGCSAGGLRAMREILSGLDSGFPLPVMITFHIAPGPSRMSELLGEASRLPVLEAGDRMAIRPGYVYLSCPDYHLIVEDDVTLGLSVDPKVCNCRPAIDMLFESAAEVFRDRLIGVVLTGANQDGAAGLRKIRALGGTGIVQDPEDAEVNTMPAMAIAQAGADHVVPLAGVAPLLNRLARCAGVPDE